MTSFKTEDVPCPVCNAMVTVRYLMSTNTFGGHDTDFRSHAIGADPLYIVISTCKACGYSDYGHYFSNPRQMSDELKRRIRETLTPLAEDEPEMSAVYANAALIATWRKAPPSEIADLYLRAAWCCADRNDSEGEMAHRKAAIKQFEQALETNEIEVSQRPVIMYLVGELYRRTGDVDTARTWFDSVLSLTSLSDKLAWLPEMAEQQRDNPQSRFPRS